MFVEFNINPKGKKTSDCVVRAIAKAENKTWLEIYDYLSKIARDTYSMPNDSKVYGKYLSGYPKINVKHEVNGKMKRLTVKEICELKGTYLVSIANHLTVVKDGNIFDTWDCGEKSAYIIWKVK
jgi:hypothetical protein